jgi:hypothetical protein
LDRFGRKKIKAETVKKRFAKAGFGKVVWQIIWMRRMKTLVQYLISAEEKNFPVIQRTLFGVMMIQPHITTLNLLQLY